MHFLALLSLFFIFFPSPPPPFSPPSFLTLTNKAQPRNQRCDLSLLRAQPEGAHDLAAGVGGEEGDERREGVGEEMEREGGRERKRQICGQRWRERERDRERERETEREKG